MPAHTNRIQELRVERGMTQKTLAEYCNTTQSAIARLETGKRKLTEHWLKVIAEALQVAPWALIDDDHKPAQVSGLARGGVTPSPVARIAQLEALLRVGLVLSTGTALPGLKDQWRRDVEAALAGDQPPET